MERRDEDFHCRSDDRFADPSGLCPGGRHRRWNGRHGWWRNGRGEGSPPCFLSDISGWSLSLVGAPPAGRRRRFLFSECRIGAVGGAGRAAARPGIEPPGTAPAPSYGVAAPVGGSAKMTLGVSAVLSLRHFGLVFIPCRGAACWPASPIPF